MLPTIKEIFINFLGTLPIEYEFIYAIFTIIFMVVFVLAVFSPFILLWKMVK